MVKYAGKENVSTVTIYIGELPLVALINKCVLFSISRMTNCFFVKSVLVAVCVINF